MFRIIQALIISFAIVFSTFLVVVGWVYVKSLEASDVATLFADQPCLGQHAFAVGIALDWHMHGDPQRIIDKIEAAPNPDEFWEAGWLVTQMEPDSERALTEATRIGAVVLERCILK